MQWEADWENRFSEHLKADGGELVIVILGDALLGSSLIEHDLDLLGHACLQPLCEQKNEIYL